MALSVLTSKRPYRHFTVYDMEWIPGTLDVRMVGVYDSERGYRWYETVEAFLSAELSSDARGRWFYAHAGGLADVQFVFEAMIRKKGYQVDSKFSGSSCIIAKVKRGKNCWTFIDSLWLMRDSLDEIGRWVGMGKGAEQSWKGKPFSQLTEEEKRDFYTNCPLPELRSYNERDCVILHEAISNMQEALIEFGGQLQMTLASSAMNLFRRRFLKRDIETHPFVNEDIREAYFASRVEVLSRKCFESFYYDINSSFPYAMTMPCPGEYLGSGRRLPEMGEADGKPYFAEVEFVVPESYFPPIPARVSGRLFFPTGRWRSWLSGIDIELLMREGGRVLRVFDVYRFAPFDDLRSYAQTIYQERKRTKDPFHKVALKLLMNTLYGKFAECAWKSSLVIDPLPGQVDYERDEMFLPGVWVKEREVPVPHMHVPISAHITAVARRTIYDFMGPCGEFYYCDTDGFACNETLQTSNELGGLKLEKILSEGDFLACKLYRLQGKILEGDTWKDLATETKHQGVKAKGFSKPSIARFEALMEGREIEAVRMRRVKELYRKGETRPREDVIKKSINIVDAVPKRYTYPDGETRPWHVKELAALQ